MISFRVTARSSRSAARLGVLSTPHGDIETPAFVPVATRAAVKAISLQQAAEAGCQLLICNTFHLHLTPGEDLVAAAGGLHSFMGWQRPLMTDSGGYQVFSLGFGRDHDVGKLRGVFPGKEQQATIKPGSQPNHVKITDDGVWFRSPRDGSKHFLGPAESLAMQRKLGADIVFAFDECTAPLTTPAYLELSLRRTHAWAERCLELHDGEQALYGIVQGSHYRELRQHSARFIGGLPFAGFGIGGDLGQDKQDMHQVLEWTVPLLPEERPRHLLGIGHPEDFDEIVRRGVDTFDCIVPTLHARHGIAFTAEGRLNLRNRRFLTDPAPLDPACSCPTCRYASRRYLAHLVRLEEIGAMAALTVHNLHYCNRLAASLREAIAKGSL
ncbi:MAG: hypothetical protein A2284_09770 [Deltaproteobacteria bacterium RIFOXYA12_FULL_61_11]|nr:MAG: hypothetical protein A2284_09770 [Deltaproteobacteria bacterium RIFOXYA12_FULL_61_11]